MPGLREQELRSAKKGGTSRRTRSPKRSPRYESSFKAVAREMLRRSEWKVNPDTGERELIFDRPISEIAEAVRRSRVVVRRQIHKMLTRGNPEKGGPALELVYQSHGGTASIYRWRRMDFVARFAPEKLRKPSRESRKPS